MINLLTDRSVLRLVQLALNEDVSTGDLTTEALVAEDGIGSARFVAKSDGVISGTQIAELALHEVDHGIAVAWNVQSGDRVSAGMTLGTADGSLRGLLTGERTALNFLQRMSGVATLTRKFVDAISGTRTGILDTRKTIPAWRLLDKHAVRDGGGVNHRMGLYDMVMIKDNHIAAHGSITNAVSAVRAYFEDNDISNIGIEVETNTLEQVSEVLTCDGVTRVMFDNYTTPMIAEGVKMVGVAMQTEASGDMTLQRVREVAETGVQFISVGALTHSAPAMNISMDIV